MRVYPVSWISCLWREGHGGSRQKWLGVDSTLTGRALERHLSFGHRDLGAFVVKYSCLENPMDGGAWGSMGSLRVGHD